MSALSKASIAAVSLGLLAACGAPEDRTPGLRFLPPEKGQSSQIVATTKSVAEIAEAYRAAGFANVTQSGDTVQIRTSSDAFVDCGTLRQYALGNTAEFSGSAEAAAVISARNDGALILRNVSVESVATVSPAGSGQMALDETHKVTVDYLLPTGGVFARSEASFTEDGMGTFEDKTFCVSSGAAASIL